MKWEYCVIPWYKPELGRGMRREIWFAHPDGCEVHQIPLIKSFTKGIKATDHAVMVAIAKLGEEGWELVSCGSIFPDGDFHTLYFKRPKQEPNL